MCAGLILLSTQLISSTIYVALRSSIQPGALRRPLCPDLCETCPSKAQLIPLTHVRMYTVISLIVQGYFCYRIWALNRRLSWTRICWIIAVVCTTPDRPRILQLEASDVSLNTGCGDSINRRNVGGHRSRFYTHFYPNGLSHTVFSRSRLESIGLSGQQYLYAHSFR